jgi:hypothetical protein
MLVYYFAEVSRPYEEAESVLFKLLGGLSEAADIAYREGEDLRAQLGIHSQGFHKTVRLDVGEPLRREGQTTIPLRWEATGATGLFPAMQADLTLARLGPRISQLAFSGSYDPPLGALGLVLDRTLHRIAEATVKRFTDRLGAALVAWPPSTPAGFPVVADSSTPDGKEPGVIQDRATPPHPRAPGGSEVRRSA